MSQAEQFATFVASIKEETIKMSEPKLIVDNTSGSNTGNWLCDLQVGTQFFVKDKLERANFLLLKLEVLKTDRKAVSLWAFPSEFGNTEEMMGKAFGTVDPDRFTNRFDLVKIIAVPSQEE